MKADESAQVLPEEESDDGAVEGLEAAIEAAIDAALELFIDAGLISLGGVGALPLERKPIGRVDLCPSL